MQNDRHNPGCTAQRAKPGASAPGRATPRNAMQQKRQTSETNPMAQSGARHRKPVGHASEQAKVQIEANGTFGRARMIAAAERTQSKPTKSIEKPSPRVANAVSMLPRARAGCETKPRAHSGARLRLYSPLPM